MVSWIIGIIFPGKVGEFSLIYLLKKERVILGRGLLISLLDKFISLTVSILVAIFGFWYFFSHDYALFLTFFVLISLFIFGFFMLSKMGRAFIRDKILGKYSVKFKGFSKLWYLYLKKEQTTLLKNYLITFIKLIVHSLGTWMIFLGLNQNVNFWIVLTIYSTAQIISIIPISISGLGVREASSVYLYAQVGVPVEIATSVSIFLLIFQYLIGPIIYLSVGSNKLIKGIFWK